MPLIVLLQGTVPRISRRPIGQKYLQEPSTIERHIKIVTGLLQGSLRMNPRRRDGPHPGTELQSARDLAGLRGLRSRLTERLIQEILKDRTRPLETVGTDVGQVVRNHVHARLLSIEAGSRNPEGTESWFYVPISYSVKESGSPCWRYVGRLQHLDLHFELPRQTDHADHRVDRINVTAFQ